MSDTPRTDAAEWRAHFGKDDEPIVWASLARELERELAKERARLDWLQAHASAQHSHYISIADLGKHFNGFPGSLRAAIDAAIASSAMKEDAT